MGWLLPIYSLVSRSLQRPADAPEYAPAGYWRGDTTDAWSSLSRIEEFLLAEEREEEVIFKSDCLRAVEVHGADFTWERTPTQESDGDGSEKKPKKVTEEDKKREMRQSRRLGEDSGIRSWRARAVQAPGHKLQD